MKGRMQKGSLTIWMEIALLPYRCNWNVNSYQFKSYNCSVKLRKGKNAGLKIAQNSWEGLVGDHLTFSTSLHVLDESRTERNTSSWRRRPFSTAICIARFSVKLLIDCMKLFFLQSHPLSASGSAGHWRSSTMVVAKIVYETRERLSWLYGPSLSCSGLTMTLPILSKPISSCFFLPQLQISYV